MAHHRILISEAGPSPWAEGDLVVVAGDEAHHAARVKRLDVGERVQLMNGRGTVADARVESITKGRGGGWELAVRVESVSAVERACPMVDVWCSAPKGDRVEGMIDQLSQIGVARWSPLTAERTVVDPRPGKLARLERVALESAKQCGRAWVMEIGSAVGLEGATAAPGLVVADATGAPYADAPMPGAHLTVLVGPEGGWSDGELGVLRSAGVRIASFGAHVMRIETAAAVAAAIVKACLPRKG